jgi:hypothetical protein
MSRRFSQRRIQDGVDIAAKCVRVNTGQPFPACNEFGWAGAAAWQRPKFGDRAAVTRDDHAFATLHAVQHFSPFVAEVAYRH